MTENSEATFSLSDFVKASQLAEQLGGVETAQEVLNALSKIGCTITPGKC